MSGTRDIILEKALDLFRREGYENAGIQKIVDASGITKPTLYHYFGSKRGLLEALLATYFDPFREPLEKTVRYDGDISMQLETIARLYFHFATEHVDFYQWYLSIVQAPEESDPGEVVRPVLEWQWKLLDQLFRDAAKDHGNMKGKSGRYAYLFLGVINTTITSSAFGLVKLDDECAFLTCKQFMHGIFS
ncbi:MAG: TetR/AcrR family transcriptional regulator [Fibrobacteraceae bacterium]